jgi:isoleucyl-tRNA synthetase
MSQNPESSAQKKSIAQKELDVLQFWQENKIFQKSLEKPAGEVAEQNFTFYDGPPFATGVPHHGHILAGTMKDVVPRYRTMKGDYVRRVWGWDCHGLPIENLIEKELNLNHKKEIEDYGLDKFNQACFDSVLRYEKDWKKVVPRVGRFVDMEHAYRTMDATYTESIWWSWKQLYEKKLAYEGHKIMHICPRCETTLAQSEVAQGYKDVTDISVTAKFELVDEPGTYLLAWTTTPWTLPGNTALALNSEATYVKLVFLNIKPVDGSKIENGFFERIILSKNCLEKTFAKTEIDGKVTYGKGDHIYSVEEEILGINLIGKRYKPVFPYYADVSLDNKENIYKVWAGDFVTLDTGTGIVHIAPAFGADDMNLAKRHKLPVIKHVSMSGQFTKEVNDFPGLYVKKVGDTQSTDVEIVKYLAHNGKLFAKEKLVHSYPHCWRCDTPLLNYATSSWFVDVPKIKDKLS